MRQKIQEPCSLFAGQHIACLAGLMLCISDSVCDCASMVYGQAAIEIIGAVEYEAFGKTCSSNTLLSSE